MASTAVGAWLIMACRVAWGRVRWVMSGRGDDRVAGVISNNTRDRQPGRNARGQCPGRISPTWLPLGQRPAHSSMLLSALSLAKQALLLPSRRGLLPEAYTTSFRASSSGRPASVRALAASSATSTASEALPCSTLPLAGAADCRQGGRPSSWASQSSEICGRGPGL